MSTPRVLGGTGQYLVRVVIPARANRNDSSLDVAALRAPRGAAGVTFW
jgi:hypothetical protein